MKTVCAWTIASIICIAAGSGRAAAGENAVDALKPGEWLEVPGSKLWDVRFEWPKGSYWTQNGVGFKAVMAGWSGGAYDTRRDRLIVWGGGHFAYGGNEIYVFDVNSLKWERASDPSLKTDKDYPNGSEKYADGTPRSCHTYNYIQYVPAIDRFMSFGTAANFPASKGGPTVWAFDFETKKWNEKGTTIAGGIGAYSAVDPVTGHVFERGNMKGALLAEWDPATGEWADRTGRVENRTDYSKTAAIDPVGRTFVAVGRGLVYKFEFGQPGKIKQDKLTTEGPQDLVESNCPGFAYDPVLDRFVGWKGGADLYLLDPATWKWEKRTPAASNKVTPTEPNRSGTYGRFRCIPSKNAYIVVNGVSENVFIGRLSDRAAEPIPKRFVEALKSRDAGLVKWVAGEVAKWPKQKAEPVLTEALKTQKGSGAADCAAALEEALKALERQA